MTSNLFSLGQVALLRVPAVRTWLRIPERVQHDPSTLPPQEGFLKSLRKGELGAEAGEKSRGLKTPSHVELTLSGPGSPPAGWKNAQVVHQVEERERRMKNHLDLAAKGKAPGTIWDQIMPYVSLPRICILSLNQ